MNIRLTLLVLQFKHSVERIPFQRFNYFHGGIGTGKSSIARLVDYCLGGNMLPTPALQAEFISASLHLKIKDINLMLERVYESDDILAEWVQNGEVITVKIPARVALDREVLPDTGIKVLSDLIFHLSHLPAPMVRSKNSKKEAGMARLSFRDLWDFCYLVQDDLDSEFFSLQEKADIHKRNKARNTLKYILGYHVERVDEITLEIEQLGKQIEKKELIIENTKGILDTLGIKSLDDLSNQLKALDEQARSLRKTIKANKKEVYVTDTHEVDLLKDKARQLYAEIDELEHEVRELESLIQKDIRQRNELLTLQTKFKRDTGARAVLGGVQFTHCPKCARTLPPREDDTCQVCGQPDEPAPQEKNTQLLELDVKDRLSELNGMIEEQKLVVVDLKKDLMLVRREKLFLDTQIDRALKTYDSAYLSKTLELERELARLERQHFDLSNLTSLPERMVTLQKQVAVLRADIQNLRAELKEVKLKALQDVKNLERLKAMFLECLVLSKLPGFEDQNVIVLEAKDLYPKVYAGSESSIYSTFANIGSGGKKTLFKCCFAIALHRLATELGAPLPEILIIDTPSKNMSASEDKEQFVAFHNMLYTFASTELKTTQFVFIDNDHHQPEEGLFDKGEMQIRHMTHTDPKHPPLISYYHGP